MWRCIKTIPAPQEFYRAGTASSGSEIPGSANACLYINFCSKDSIRIEIVSLHTPVQFTVNCSVGTQKACCEEWGSCWSTTSPPPNLSHIHVLDCKYYVFYNQKNHWNSNVCRGPSRPDCACVSLFTATGGLLTIRWRGGEGSIIYSVLGCDKIADSNTVLPDGSSLMYTINCLQHYWKIWNSIYM